MSAPVTAQVAHLGFKAEGIAICEIERGCDGPEPAAHLELLLMRGWVHPGEICVNCKDALWRAVVRAQGGRRH